MSLISYYFFGGRGSSGYTCLCRETGGNGLLCLVFEAHVFWGIITTLAASPLGHCEALWSIWETGFLTDSSSKLDWMSLAYIHWWSWS